MYSKYYFIYIITNKKNGVLYTGVTDNLKRRIWEHKKKIVKGFSKRYGLDKLIYYEVYQDIKKAIKREKAIKKWNRSWKIRLIEKDNKDWQDLFNTLD